MATEILMPELGESVHEGTVSRWLKNVGDTVKEDEPVVEIMTDKVNTELQAPASGVLIKILINEGENVKVFEPLGLIGEASEVGGEPQKKTEPPKEKIEEAGKLIESVVPSTTSTQPVETPKPIADGGRKWYTPIVRSIAKQHGVREEELASIRGTGEGGRVTKKDLEMYLQTRTGVSVSVTQASEVETKAPSELFEVKPMQVQEGPDVDLVALTGMRKAIADAMTKAHTIPAVSTITAVDVSKLVEFRKLNKDSFEKNYGVRLTYTPFFIKALTEALMEFPIVNGAYTDDGKLQINRVVHLGVAVALGDGSQGLIVPVIRDCHKKNLVEIAKELDSIAKKARDNKLNVTDVQGATFTLTNPGSYGALFGTPMIPPGQAGILGTYAIVDTPVAVNRMLGIKPIMHLVLTYDHRIIDGMLAGRFLKVVKDRLEGFDFYR